MRSAETVPAGFVLRQFEQKLDHFNCLAHANATFAQRYLLRDAEWREGAPMFVFTGAEGGDVTRVIGDYGLVLELADELGAIVVAVEGRFFGASVPGGHPAAHAIGRGMSLASTGSGTPAPNSTIGTLSVEQMLEDYAAIIETVREEYSLGGWSGPVITFGGSLAGTLAALMRLSRPWLVDAAFASSSPLLGWTGQVDPFAWRARITTTWEESHAGCAALVRRGFAGLAELTPTEVAKQYKTCNQPFKGNNAAVRSIVWGQLETHAEFVYNVGLAKLTAACQRMSKPVSNDGAIFARFLNIATDASTDTSRVQESRCLNLSEPLGAEGPGRCESGCSRGVGLDVAAFAGNTPASRHLDGWGYMACTQIIHPIAANNVTDFFPPSNWSITGLTRSCRHQWGAETRPHELSLRYGLNVRALARSASRILFSYGSRDPWATMGVGWQNLSEELPVVAVEGGSHCADVASTRPGDTEAMLQARQAERQILRRWIGGSMRLEGGALVH